MNFLENNQILLSENQFQYNLCKHEATRTVSDLKIVKFDGEFANAVHTKNLLLRDGRKKDRLWLVIPII